uniref:SET domain-containing protein n=1 Tax=Dracunculus medinensis TaxID=318479 RepID=A0A0N4UEJ3_DRAME
LYEGEESAGFEKEKKDSNESKSSRRFQVCFQYILLCVEINFVFNSLYNRIGHYSLIIIFSFICEYIGEIIPMREFLKYRSFLHHRRMKNYAVKLSSEFVVDASSRGNISRFINHSCKPNCEIQSINGILRIGIFALRSIKKEEELSYRYSYDFEYFSKCLCNSSKCCGFIGDSASLTAKEIELIRKKKLLLLRNLRSCVGNHQTLPKLGIFYTFFIYCISIFIEILKCVGSYDPDIIDYSICANEESDCVRCICGTPDDDGQMVQCGKCYFWLHGECIPNFNSDEYICEICSQRPLRTPTVEILLRTKLELELKRCIYYRTLVNNRNIQVRINEAVYVQRPVNDNHKTELRILEAAKNSYTDDIEYSCVHTSNQPPAFDSIFQKAAFNRKNLMCFRVERLLLTPSGSKLVFGFYYARPHEVYCEPSKMFHEKEVFLFATTLFDTLPLDCVVGRCLILDSTMYCAGRPRVPRYHESDVFFCDTGYNTKISKFEKLLPKYHYTISTDPLIFERFPEKLQIARSFSNHYYSKLERLVIMKRLKYQNLLRI